MNKLPKTVREAFIKHGIPPTLEYLEGYRRWLNQQEIKELDRQVEVAKTKDYQKELEEQEPIAVFIRYKKKE